MNKDEFVAEFEAIKHKLPPKAVEVAEQMIADMPDDLFTEEFDTWGDGFGAEGYVPGGRIAVGKSMGVRGAPDDRTLGVTILSNTWGVDVAEFGARATQVAAQKAKAEGKDEVQPYVPTVHLNREQWEHLRAIGDRVFPQQQGVEV